MNFFNQFGLVSYAMLVVSFIIVAICLERLLTFITLPKLCAKKYTNVINAILHNDIKTASILIKDFKQPFSGYFSTLINDSKDVAESELSLQMSKNRSKLQRPLIWLNLFAVISPMLGLLGTIWSMSHSFAALATSLAGGGLQNMIMYLSQAMYATAAGIFLALISMLGFYSLRQYSERYLSDIENSLNHFSINIQRLSMCVKKNHSLAKTEDSTADV